MGAAIADIVMQSMGLAGLGVALLMLVFGVTRVAQADPDAERKDLRRARSSAPWACWPWPACWPPRRRPPSGSWKRAWAASGATPCCTWSPASCASPAFPARTSSPPCCSPSPPSSPWASPSACAEVDPDAIHAAVIQRPAAARPRRARTRAGRRPVRVKREKAEAPPKRAPAACRRSTTRTVPSSPPHRLRLRARVQARLHPAARPPSMTSDEAFEDMLDARPMAIAKPKTVPKESGREAARAAEGLRLRGGGRLPAARAGHAGQAQAALVGVDAGALRQNARLLESVLAEFGVKGQIDQIRPGPVVTMYELVPAPASRPPGSWPWPTTSPAR
jgi:S-DNA-T family DNA segregation ATPase FtsK/SpoIIIE